MKKNLLFILNKLVCGGAEKSLISLLETIDYTSYNVDLFLFKHEGTFLKKLPNEVNLLPEPKNYKYIDLPLKNSLFELVSKKDYKLVMNRGVLGFLAKTEKNGAKVEQKFWKYLASSLSHLPKEYDVAIGFQEKSPIYYLVDRVKAKKKIGWIHTDLNKLNINVKKENFYLSQLDHIVTVSEDLVNKLKDMFPNNENKIECIHNIISTNIINNLSIEPVEDMISEEAVNLISVGRLAKEKGLELTLNALEILIRKGYKIKWYLIGEGDQQNLLEEAIKEKGLNNHVEFLGLKENPYPYIKKADIFVQTSRYEGKSISIEEAKVLGKPIVITNFETATNHVIHGKTGLISEMNEDEIAINIQSLIDNKALRTQLSQNLIMECHGTEDEVNKFYSLLEDKVTINL
ncbi:glycosyltransferase [Robertmurraya korlensis]|uniref:glycosyltransferase n=1 Tax=Robertmurraya korlensis TaxID=519977 RepID=UPI0008242EB5|nr:glycosyltransferase [Robertmurraya korlensis]